MATLAKMAKMAKMAEVAKMAKLANQTLVARRSNGHRPAANLHNVLQDNGNAAV